MKSCSNANCQCINPQSKTNFSKRSEAKDGLQSNCKSCVRIGKQLYWIKNKERLNLQHKKWYDLTKDNKDFKLKRKEQSHNFYKRNRFYATNWNIKKKYGITIDDYNKLMEKQNNLCAICNKPETKMSKVFNDRKKLSVDHCHTTGKVRGLLCSKCNNAIGLLYDDIENFKNAIKYLEENR